MSTDKIKLNAAKCLKCNQVIESLHVHDFVRCKCGNIFVDGGTSYIRRGVKDGSMYQDMSEFE